MWGVLRLGRLIIRFDLAGGNSLFGPVQIVPLQEGQWLVQNNASCSASALALDSMKGGFFPKVLRMYLKLKGWPPSFQSCYVLTFEMTALLLRHKAPGLVRS